MAEYLFVGGPLHGQVFKVEGHRYQLADGRTYSYKTFAMAGRPMAAMFYDRPTENDVADRVDLTKLWLNGKLALAEAPMPANVESAETHFVCGDKKISLHHGPTVV